MSVVGWLTKAVAQYQRLDAALQRATGGAAAGTGGSRLSGDRVTGVALLLRQLAFSAAVRAEIWQLLGDVVEAGVSLDETLETMIDGYLRAGKAGRAKVLAEMRAGMLDNDACERLGPYISPPERLIFDALGRQEAHLIFGSAARLLRNRLALRKALTEAIAMPILLTVSLFALVLFFGYELLPALADIVDFDTLPLVQSVTVTVTLAMADNPLALFVGIGAFITVLGLLMRFWTGRGRVTADRFPPFSVMRLQSGTGFLFSVIEYGRNGTAITANLLREMQKIAGYYERSRIRALVRPLEQTGNLGQAAIAAGQGFPDDEIAVVLRVLWNRDDGISRAGQFLERRLEKIESNVRARMAVLNAVLLILVTVVLVLLLSVMMPVFDQLNAGGF